MRLRFLPWPLAGLAVGLGVCHCTSPVTPTGELGNGQFTYLCTSGSVDVGCTGQDSPEASIAFEDPSLGVGTTSLPRVIAVGATFAFNYTVLADAGSIQGNTGYAILPASPELASTSGDSFVALRSGFLALLAFNSASQTVDDFVIVNFQPIATLTPSEAKPTLSPGALAAVSVTAADAAGEPLGGRLACSWTVAAGADFVSLEGSSAGASTEIEGVATGDATVRATCGGVSTDLTVHVNPAVPFDGGAEGGDP